MSVYGVSLPPPVQDHQGRGGSGGSLRRCRQRRGTGGCGVTVGASRTRRGRATRGPVTVGPRDESRGGRRSPPLGPEPRHSRIQTKTYVESRETIRVSFTGRTHGTEFKPYILRPDPPSRTEGGDRTLPLPWFEYHSEHSEPASDHEPSPRERPRTQMTYHRRRHVFKVYTGSFYIVRQKGTRV